MKASGTSLNFPIRNSKFEIDNYSFFASLTAFATSGTI